MNEHTFDTIIVGGGISGLAAAWQLKKAGVDVCLIEANEQVGGYTRTQRRDGFLLEKGPFNVIVRDPSFEALLDDVSDEVEVVAASKAASKRFIYHRGRLFNVPTNPIALLTTGLLSFGARLRLIRGLFFSAPAGPIEESIAQAATRRFGKEVADTMISAAISGILAGDISKLSLAACFPGVGHVDAEAISLIGYGLKKALGKKGKKKDKHKRRWRGLVSIDGGLGALTETIGKRLGNGLLSGCKVDGIVRRGDKFEVTCAKGETDRHTLRGRRLVLAAGVKEAADLLNPLAPEAAEAVAPIENASLAVLSLGFRRAQISHPLEGFGFLVPQNEPDFPLMGVLFADSIFPHHAPDGHRLLRVFIGGARDPNALQKNDDQLLATALDGLRDLLGVSGDPVMVDTCRYPSAIPQYHAGHRERIETFRRAIETVPDLHVIGNYLEGVSLNDCVRLATRVADELIATIDRDPVGVAERRVAAVAR